MRRSATIDAIKSAIEFRWTAFTRKRQGDACAEVLIATKLLSFLSEIGLRNRSLWLNMSITQHQHYLPQSYQRGWADAENRVHVYEWRQNKLVCAPKSTKSTGGRAGLYFISMAPPGHQNFMEDVFWKKIDQWGADGLTLLRNNDPAAGSKINRERLAIFIMSLEFRNPRKIAQLDADARRCVLAGCLKDNYAANRAPHEPETFDEFVEALDQPGLTELGAKYLRTLVFSQAIRTQLLSMDWQVVAITNGEPLLTSDVPLIRYKGLKEDDGILLLPISPKEFFVAFNHGSIDMMKSIDYNIQTGIFIDAINRYVVRSKIEFVYGVDDSQMRFVEQNWAVSASLS